eukprot:10001558-Ditylum_brightwellii.AAC.1
MRDPPPGIGVLGIGGIEKPMGFGTIIFQITDSTLEAKTIELENVLYIPSIPKSLISISQWSTERKDDCGILSKGNYSISLWNNDASQKLVPHPVNCRIPMLQAHEGGETEFDRLQEEYKHYLHDQKRDHTANTPNSQQDIEEPGLDQQPNFGDSCPAGMTVKWKHKGKVKLAAVMKSSQQATPGTEPTSTIR